MKKIILWVLLAAVVIGAVIGVAVSCNNTADPQQTETPTNATTPAGETSVEDVIAYLKSIYKDDGAKTPIDYERYGIVRIAGVPYEVVWTADVGEEFIKVVVNDDGTVTIDVNEECEADTPYVLTATVTDENGNTASHSWNYILPEAVDMVAIVKAAYALAPGESLPYESTLRGKIISIKTPYDPSYKNITVVIEIEGAEDMPIECYRLKGEGVEDLQIGDIITVTGTLKNYNGTIEFDAGCILEQVIVGERVQAPSDPKQIVDEAYALGANKSLPYEATLTGTIISVDQPYDEYYGNITVTIEIEGREGKPIKCYRMKGDGVDKIGVNDLITVRGYITNYVGSKGHSTIEFTAGCIMEAWEDREAPVAPSDPKQIVDEAYALGANKSLRYEATLTGKITKVDQEYDPDYGNITVTMVIEGRETKPIVCYRMKGSGVDKIDIGDTITVRGYIKNYVGSAGYSTIEFDYPTLVSYKKSNIKAPTDMVQIVKDAYALAAGAQLPYKATLTGRVTMINAAYDSEYDNITVTIEVEGTKNMPIKCYRLEGEGVSKIDIGNIITVTGYIENYQHSSGDTEVEFVKGCKMTSWSKGEAVTAPADPVQIVKEAYALEPGASLKYKATLTGTITKVKTPYDAGYKNVTVVMEVAGTKDMPITCYRLKGDGAGKIGVGDIITVSGYITKYQHSSGDCEVEFTAGCTLDKWMHADGTTEPDEPDVPEVPTTQFEATLVENPKTGVAYKMAMNKKGSFLFFNGQTDGSISYRLGSSMDAFEAVDVYLEAVSGVKNAYRLYFMNGNTKTYIRVYERVKDESGTLAGSLEMVTKVPAEYFTYNTAAKTLVYTKGENSYYMGTYSTYTTFSVSSTYYITGDKASSLDETQFPARFYNVKVDESTRPTTPTAPTDPVQIVKDAYALAAGKDLPYKATLTGEVTKITDAYSTQYKNITVIIEVAGTKDMPIKCFRLAGNDADKIAVGDTITVSGTITNFQHSSGDTEVEFKQGCTLDKWTPSGTTQPTEPTEPKPTEPTTPPETSDALKTGDEVVIFAPAYNKALSADKVDEKSYYNKGVDITVKNGQVSGYGDAEIWTVTKNSDGTYSFANGGKNIALADEFASMNLGEKHDDWQLISLGGTLYNIKNVGRGNFIEWYAEKNNWSTYASSKAATDDQFQLSIFVIGKGVLEEETKPTTPTDPEPTEPEVTDPVTPPAGDKVTLVETPAAGVAYKMGMNKNDGNILLFNGQTESADVTYRLATVVDAAEAVDVYLEAVEGVEGGYRLYFMNGDVKTYIRVYERTDGAAGAGKGSLELVTEVPAEYLTYDKTAKTLIYTADADNAYYLGTYSTFVTFSVSNTSYITGGNAANVDVTQFPARFYTVEAGEEPTEPTTPETTEPEVTKPAEDKITLVDEPQTGVAYKMGMNKNQGNILFFNGQTESETVTYRLATSVNTAEAVDVYLETVEGVEGGYRLYFMNGDVKTYIRVYERTKSDGNLSGSLELVTNVPEEYFTYDAVVKTLIYTNGENSYYMGTYSTYTTFSVSSTYYIAGDKAATVDVSQFPARFYTVEEGTVPETTEPETTEPEATEPEATNPADGTVVLAEELKVGVPYKMGMDKNEGNVLLFNGQTESAEVNYRLATVVPTAESVDVYLEAVEGVEGGYRLYFMNNGVKTYIRVYERTKSNGQLSGSLELVTSVPEEYFTYDAVVKTLIYTNGENSYYMGTYSTYTTFSVSSTYYITGDKASNVDVSQFPARFYTVEEGKEPETTEPSQPSTEPSQPSTEPSTPESSESVELSFDDAANRLSWDANQQVWQANGITVTNDKTEASSEIIDKVGPARFYQSSKLTIAASGMTKIVVNCNDYKDYATSLVNSLAGIAGVTATKDGTVVTIQFAAATDSLVIEALAAQVRIHSIVIYK